MRVRTGIFVLLLAAALSSCTGDDPESTSKSDPTETPLTEVTVSCPEFSEVSEKINEAQSKLYDGTGGSEAVDDLVAELEALKDDAPQDIQDALTTMSEAFRDAADILANPSPENQSRLAELGPKLAAEGQKVTEYIQQQCE